MIERPEIRKRDRIRIWARPLQSRKIGWIESAYERLESFRWNAGMFLLRFIRHRRRHRKDEIGAPHDGGNQPCLDSVGHPIAENGKFMAQRPGIAKIDDPSHPGQPL